MEQQYIFLASQLVNDSNPQVVKQETNQSYEKLEYNQIMKFNESNFNQTLRMIQDYKIDAQNCQLNEKIINLKNELNNITNEKNKIETEFNKYKQVNQNTISLQKQRIKQSQILIQKIQQENKQSLKQIQQLKDSEKKNKQKIMKLNSDKFKKTKENQKLLQQLKQKQLLISKIQVTRQQKINQIKYYASQNQKLNFQIRLLKRKCNQYQIQINKIQDLENTKLELIQQIQQLKNFIHRQRIEHNRTFQLINQQLHQIKQENDHLQIKLSRLNDQYNRTCIICCTNPSNMVNSQCGHVNLCEACSKIQKFCPLCRKNTNRYIKIFKS